MRVFISHISEEAAVAAVLKKELQKDFLDMVEVFVSSDGTSIAAGDEWLKCIYEALNDCSLLMVLCSPASIRRPWIKFEAGAAWMRQVPIVPICHNTLNPGDLPMPLSLRQGICLDDAEGLRRTYDRIAELRPCRVPARSFDDLARQLAAESINVSSADADALQELKDDRGITMRLHQALRDPKWKWRSLKRLAVLVAAPEEVVADRLRADQQVRFGSNASGEVIVGLRSIVGDG